MNILFYDTETTGLPNRNRPFTHPCQPRVTQMGFLYEENGVEVSSLDSLVKPDGPNWQISPTASALTGITREMCEDTGMPLAEMMDAFVDHCAMADVIICHNVSFDSLLMMMEAARLAPDMEPRSIFEGKPHVCTMLAATPICRLPKKDKRTGFKWPKLEEAIMFFFGEKLDGAHDAMVDITATQRLFRHLCNINAMDKPFANHGLKTPAYPWDKACGEDPRNG